MKNTTRAIPVGFGRWLPLLCWLAAVSTATALQSGDFTYEINSPDTNTVTITGYTGDGGAVVIPSTIDSKDVTTIGTNAFYYCDTMTSVSRLDSRFKFKWLWYDLPAQVWTNSGRYVRMRSTRAPEI